jgi:hypothetical protein
MAVSGESFCTSAWNGFLCNLKHLAKFYFAQTIAGLFIFMGVLCVTCCNTLAGYVITKYIIKDTANVTSLVPAIMVFFIISLIAAVVFLGTFDEAVLATLMCFAIDLDLNDGSPKFGPKSYHDKLRSIGLKSDDDNG